MINNVIELIGNTPLIKLNKITKDLPCKVFVKVESFNEIEVMFDYANDVVKEMSLASTGDSIVVVAGLPIGVKGNTNLIRVITIS